MELVVQTASRVTGNPATFGHMPVTNTWEVPSCSFSNTAKHTIHMYAEPPARQRLAASSQPHEKQRTEWLVLPRPSEQGSGEQPLRKLFVLVSEVAQISLESRFYTKLYFPVCSFAQLPHLARKGYNIPEF